MNKLNKSGEIPQPYFDPMVVSNGWSDCDQFGIYKYSNLNANKQICLRYRHKVLILPSAFPAQTEVALSANKERFKITKNLNQCFLIINLKQIDILGAKMGVALQK